MLLIFDTETTGLMPGQICQLSYVMAEGTAMTAKNYFFAVDSMSFPAVAVHGLSEELLEKLSGGRRFSDCATDVLADFKAADVVAAHNLDFDMRFLKKELERCNLRYRPRRGLCTMYYFTKILGLPGRNNQPKPPRLSELADYFGISPESAAQWAGDVFGGGTGAHDARNDAATTFLCVREAIGRGLLRNLLKENTVNEALES